MSLTVPVKTLTGFVILAGSLALWPRFIEARFVMPALTNRDANAEAPWEMFDFDHRSNEDPGSPPEPTIDQAKLDGCIQVFGPAP